MNPKSILKANKDLVNAFKFVNKEFERGNNSMRLAEKSLTVYRKSISKITSEIDSMKNAIFGLVGVGFSFAALFSEWEQGVRLFGELQDKSIKLSRSFGDMSAAGDLMNQTMRGAVKYGESFDQFASTIETMTKYRTQLGRTTEEFRNITEQASDFGVAIGGTTQQGAEMFGKLLGVAKMTPRELKSVTKEVAALQNSIGLAAEEVQSLIDGMVPLLQVIRNVGGTSADIDEFTRSMGKLTVGFGAMGRSAGEAADFMKRIMDPERFNENIMLFSQLGFSADRAFKLMQGQDTETFVDEMMDKLPELAKNISKMNPLVQAHFSKMLGIGRDELLQFQHMNSKEAKLAMQQRETERKKEEAFQKQWQQSMKTWQRWLMSFQQQMELISIEIAKSLGFDNFMELKNVGLELKKSLVEGLKNLKIKEWIKTAIPYFKMFIKFVTDVTKPISVTLNKYLDQIRGFIDRAGPKLGEIFSTIVKGVTEILPYVEKIINSITDIGNDIHDKFGATGVIGALLGIKFLPEIIGGTGQLIKKIGGAALPEILGGKGSLMRKVKGIQDVFVTNAKDIFGNGKVKEILTGKNGPFKKLGPMLMRFIPKMFGIFSKLGPMLARLGSLLAKFAGPIAIAAALVTSGLNAKSMKDFGGSDKEAATAAIFETATFGAIDMKEHVTRAAYNDRMFGQGRHEIVRGTSGIDYAQQGREGALAKNFLNAFAEEAAKSTQKYYAESLLKSGGIGEKALSEMTKSANLEALISNENLMRMAKESVTGKKQNTLSGVTFDDNFSRKNALSADLMNEDYFERVSATITQYGDTVKETNFKLVKEFRQNQLKKDGESFISGFKFAKNKISDQLKKGLISKEEADQAVKALQNSARQMNAGMEKIAMEQSSQIGIKVGKFFDSFGDALGAGLDSIILSLREFMSENFKIPETALDSILGSKKSLEDSIRYYKTDKALLNLQKETKLKELMSSTTGLRTLIQAGHVGGNNSALAQIISDMTKDVSMPEERRQEFVNDLKEYLKGQQPIFNRMLKLQEEMLQTNKENTDLTKIGVGYQEKQVKELEKINRKKPTRTIDLGSIAIRANENGGASMLYS